MSTNKIFVVGDCHRDLDIGKLNSKNFPIGETLTRDDYVIICGDAGIVWDGGELDRGIQKWYDNKPWTTLFVDGNHENHDLLRQYPVTEWHGGKVHQITPNIIHLMRGEHYEINGHTFFVFGGAQSHDKWCRTENVDWWAHEMPTREEYEYGLDTIDLYPDGVDFILTHEGPYNAVDELGYYGHNKLSNFLEVVRETWHYKHWFFGHYHRDIDLSDEMSCLYYDVVEIKADGSWERNI